MSFATFGTLCNLWYPAWISTSSGTPEYPGKAVMCNTAIAMQFKVRLGVCIPYVGLVAHIPANWVVDGLATS